MGAPSRSALRTTLLQTSLVKTFQHPCDIVHFCRDAVSETDRHIICLLEVISVPLHIAVWCWYHLIVLVCVTVWPVD